MEGLGPVPPSPADLPPDDRVPIVGLGTSAGGVEALERFLGSAPARGGVAYVAMVHLDPEGESQVAQILGRSAPMPVREVLEDTKVEPNHVYVVSPKSRLDIDDAYLRVGPLPPRIPRLTINQFFRGLATARGSGAVAVVLSGTGRDGILGLRAIREQGGIAAAQDPADAEFPETPRFAQATGYANLVRAADELPLELLGLLARHPEARTEVGETEPLRGDAERPMQDLRVAEGGSIPGLRRRRARPGTEPRRSRRKRAEQGNPPPPGRSRHLAELRSVKEELATLRARADEKEAWLSTLMEHMPVGVLIVDCATREPLLMNRRSRRILGGLGATGREGSAEGGAPAELPDFLDRVVQQLIDTGRPVLDQRVPLPRAAPPRDLLVSGAMVSGSDEEPVECILTLADIEDVLARARELARDAERSKLGVLATISHELRTPLNAITGYTALLIEGLPDALTEAQEQHVRRVRECTEQLLGMVEQILTLAQLGEGGAPLTPGSVDPRTPLGVAALLIEPEAKRRGLDLRVEADEDLGEVVTDAERIRQVLVNLAQNAVKYTREGEVVLSVRSDESGGAVFEVRDTGIGIAPEHQERIFERFWQVRPADRSPGAEGAGIGLSVAKSLVELLQGTIEVESEPGRGSTFRVRLPPVLEVRSGADAASTPGR